MKSRQQLLLIGESFSPWTKKARSEPPLGPETRKCWNNSALAAEFQDLLHWRDRLAGLDATSYSQY